MTIRLFIFNSSDGSPLKRDRREKLAEKVNGWNENQLLNTSVDDLCMYFVDKYRIDIPDLNRDGIVVDQHETRIYASKDRSRAIRDRSQPSYVLGTTIEITVPFTGDSQAFTVRPRTFSLDSLLPCVTVGVQTLTILITDINLESGEVRRRIKHILDSIDRALNTLREHAKTLNRQLESMARLRIEQRRKKLLANHEPRCFSWFPLKQRNDSPKTYRAPEVRRKITAVPPPASSIPYEPEPTLGDTDYEHILEVIENMAQVMERSPSALFRNG